MLKWLRNRIASWLFPELQRLRMQHDSHRFEAAVADWHAQKRERLQRADRVL